MSYTVLIVDDSGFVRSTIKDIVTNAGFTVVGEAKDGAEALDSIIELRPDVVTLDNILPDMTGLEILKVLKENGIESKVIMISAVAQQSAIQEGLSLGAEAYLIKPITADKLIDQMKQSLES